MTRIALKRLQEKGMVVRIRSPGEDGLPDMEHYQLNDDVAP